MLRVQGESRGLDWLEGEKDEYGVKTRIARCVRMDAIPPVASLPLMARLGVERDE